MIIKHDKRLYGEKVLLYEEEYEKLMEKFGAADAATLVEILDNYLINKPRKRYESHYRAILSWCVSELNEQRLKEQRLRNAREAGQRMSGQAPAVPEGERTTMEDVRRKMEEINAKYK